MYGLQDVSLGRAKKSKMVVLESKRVVEKKSSVMLILLGPRMRWERSNRYCWKVGRCHHLTKVLGLKIYSFNNYIVNVDFFNRGNYERKFVLN